MSCHAVDSAPCCVQDNVSHVQFAIYPVLQITISSAEPPDPGIRTLFRRFTLGRTMSTLHCYNSHLGDVGQQLNAMSHLYTRMKDHLLTTHKEEKHESQRAAPMLYQVS